MGVMTLAASRGSRVTIGAEGQQAEEALAALVALIADKFGEGE
jgi:phosphocarrier protein